MFAPLILTAALALAPAQGDSGGLQLTNVRNTFGVLGPIRATSKMLPGDVLFVAYDIDGVTIDKAGKVQYSMAMEVVDKDKKTVFKQDPAEKVDFVPLGGTRLPARAFITLGLDQPPGLYTLKVTVIDRANKAEKTLSHPFEVLPKGFGIVAVYASIDERGQIPAPTTGIVGQSVFIQFAAVGFERDPKSKQPDLRFEMMPLDDTGKPTLAEPSAHDAKAGVDDKDNVYQVRFLLPMTRAGKYSIRLTAEDKIGKKKATFELPVVVLAAEK
jgi:hypothetical protein